MEIQEQRAVEINSKVNFALGTTVTKPIDKSLMTGTSNLSKNEGGTKNKGD